MFLKNILVFFPLKKLGPVFYRECTNQCTATNPALEEIANLLANRLGYTHTHAYKIAASVKLDRYDLESIGEIVDFCKSLGYNKDDIDVYPALLKMKPMVLDQRYNVLKEGGFTTVTTGILSRYRKLIHSPISKLKSLNYIPAHTDVPKSFISHLNPKPDILDTSDMNDDSRWSAVHLNIIKRYLMWRLDATPEEIERLFRTHKMVRGKSLVFLCENIALAQELKFPLRKLLKYGYLLHNYPKHTRRALETMPNIAGMDLRRSMRLYPKLVNVSPKNYAKIHKILKDANIPDSQIRRAINVYHLSPKTVQARLDALKSTPEFEVLMNNNRVLHLIVHLHRAKSRLAFLRDVKMKCASLLVLGNDQNEIFNNHIRVGKDVNSKPEMIKFVMHLLGTDKTVQKDLEKHPFYLNVPYTDMKETRKYLGELGYDDKSVREAVQILLYPKEKIETALEKISEHDIDTNTITQTQCLNLILYYIEKDHHFTGNGIWVDT